MTVDRVAQAMTEGAPRAGFTARVMAPILGGPRPGFTRRVMAGLDAPEQRAPARALPPALAAVGALVVAAVTTVRWLPDNSAWPAAPEAPPLSARPYDRAAIDVPPLPYDRWAPHMNARRLHAAARPRATQARSAVSENGERPGASIHLIEPLTGPVAIAVRAIEPPAPSIRALTAPEALAIRGLRFKEQP